jgi:hypothetical protein
MSYGYVWGRWSRFNQGWVRHSFSLAEADYQRHEAGAAVEPFYVAACGVRTGYRTIRGGFAPMPGHPPREVWGKAKPCPNCPEEDP